MRLNEVVLNDTLTVKDVIFNQSENKTVYIRLPKCADIIDARLNLSGYYNCGDDCLQIKDYYPNYEYPYGICRPEGTCKETEFDFSLLEPYGLNDSCSSGTTCCCYAACTNCPDIPASSPLDYCLSPCNDSSTTLSGQTYFADKCTSTAGGEDRGDNICRSSTFASGCTADPECNGVTAGTGSCNSMCEFTPDTTPPQWRNQDQNTSTPNVGEAILLYAEAWDENA